MFIDRQIVRANYSIHSISPYIPHNIHNIAHYPSQLQYHAVYICETILLDLWKLAILEPWTKKISEPHFHARLNTGLPPRSRATWVCRRHTCTTFYHAAPSDAISWLSLKRGLSTTGTRRNPISPQRNSLPPTSSTLPPCSGPTPIRPTTKPLSFTTASPPSTRRLTHTPELYLNKAGNANLPIGTTRRTKP